jgi:hypothetical protein
MYSSILSSAEVMELYTTDVVFKLDLSNVHRNASVERIRKGLSPQLTPTTERIGRYVIHMNRMKQSGVNKYFQISDLVRACNNFFLSSHIKSVS